MMGGHPPFGGYQNQGFGGNQGGGYGGNTGYGVASFGSQMSFPGNGTTHQGYKIGGYNQN